MIALSELGYCGSGGMGAAPLTATEMQAWKAGTGAELSQWEFSLILEASRAFVSGLNADSPPYMPKVTRMAIASAKVAEAMD